MVETVNQHPGPPKPGPTIQNHIMLRAAVPTSQSYTAAPSYNWFRLESGCDHFAGLRDRRPVGESILGGSLVYLARGKSGTSSLTESKNQRSSRFLAEGWCMYILYAQEVVTHFI